MRSDSLFVKHLRDGAFFFAKRIAESLELMDGGFACLFLGRGVHPRLTWNRSWNPKMEVRKMMFLLFPFQV